MKKIVFTALSASLLALAFSACSDNNDSETDLVKETKVVVDVNCSESATEGIIESYITMLSGDVLVEDMNNTIVKIYHDNNGTKKICLVEGSAHLIRE